MIRRGRSWWGWWQKRFWPQPIEAELTGYRFNTDPTLTAQHTSDGTLTGTAFSSSPALYDAARVTGATPKTIPTLTALATNEAYLTGSAFSSTAELFGDSRLTGKAFLTSPSLLAERGIELTGIAFGTQEALLGGSSLVAESFVGEPILIATATNEAWLTGNTFASQLTAQVVSETTALVTGDTFISQSGLYSGADLLGQPFTSNLYAEAIGITSAYLTGSGFKSEITLTAEGLAYGKLTGNGFASGLWTVIDGFVNGFPYLIGQGFITDTPILTASEIVSPSVAFVMNIRTAEVSRYTDYPFKGFLKMAGQYYGVKDDGLYLINGAFTGERYVETKEMDFGAYNSKSVPDFYLNSDTETTLTATADNQISPPYTSEFNGRKTQIGRGLRGRYWLLKVADIERLEGIELNIAPRQRRVK